MDIQKERELFEKHASKFFTDSAEAFKTNGDQYLYDEVIWMWDCWIERAKAQAVPAKLILELEEGRFKEYEFKALLRQSLRASKIRKLTLNWVHVMGMLGTGSTVAHRICEALGINPDGTKFELIKAQEPVND